MKKVVLVSLCASVLAGIGAYYVSYYVRTSGPIVECPVEVDLGLLENGRNFVSSIPIRNPGRESLVVSGFRTSCGCIIVQKLGASGLIEPMGESCVIAPGQQMTIVPTVVTRGSVGNTLRESIHFRTNDPQHPDRSITIKVDVDGVVAAVPSELSLGEFMVGQNAVKRVEVRDTGRSKPFRLAKVESSAARVKVLKAETGQEAQARPEGKLVCQIDVLIVGEEPGEVLEKLHVYERDEEKPSVTVLVSARVLPKFQVTPAAIVLPRLDGHGRFVRSCVCVVKCNDNSPFSLVAARPDGLRVKMLPDEGSVRRIEITYDESDKAMPGRHVIALTAKTSGCSEVIELPVTIWDGERMLATEARCKAAN